MTDDTTHSAPEGRPCPLIKGQHHPHGWGDLTGTRYHCAGVRRCPTCHQPADDDGVLREHHLQCPHFRTEVTEGDNR